MATRSHIGIMGKGGRINFIYSHWDGYPSHNGKILLENYKDEKKVRALVRLGSISVLGEEVGVKHPFDRPSIMDEAAAAAFAAKYGKMTTAYRRDRGEAIEHCRVGRAANEAEFLRKADDCYAYLFKGGEWFFRAGREQLRKLTPKDCEASDD
jgi:hypothetical protein